MRTKYRVVVKMSKIRKLNKQTRNLANGTKDENLAEIILSTIIKTTTGQAVLKHTS